MQITQTETLKNVPFNFVVNVVDGSFFGLGLGLTSSVTVLPLFLSNFTDSAALIGMISSVHLIGWHLPQLLTVRRVARQSRYKPMTLFMTLQERWPFLALAGVALLVPVIPDWLALLLTFVLYGWHSFGAGVTATAWQSMIGHIMPTSLYGRFFGAQSAGFSLLSGVGALVAGGVLVALPYPSNFALCFLLASIAMVISFIFLAVTREPERPRPPVEQVAVPLRAQLASILQRDRPFHWYLGARMMAQFALVGLSFYTLYSVRRFELEADALGLMTSVLLFTQTFAHPFCGWLGDRIGHRWTFTVGALALAAANLIAVVAQEPAWMLLVFGLAGLGNAAFTTAILTLNLTFGTETERPYYIGLGNTLVAPFTIIAPLVGGLLVDGVSFTAMFMLTLVAAALTSVILMLSLRQQRAQAAVQTR